jgi:hypothetical protein
VPREKYAITSKWGVMHKDQKFLPIDTSPKACRAAVEESLKQLQARRAAFACAATCMAALVQAQLPRSLCSARVLVLPRIALQWALHAHAL